MITPSHRGAVYIEHKNSAFATFAHPIEDVVSGDGGVFRCFSGVRRCNRSVSRNSDDNVVNTQIIVSASNRTLTVEGDADNLSREIGKGKGDLRGRVGHIGEIIVVAVYCVAAPLRNRSPTGAVVASGKHDETIIFNANTRIRSIGVVILGQHIVKGECSIFGEIDFGCHQPILTRSTIEINLYMR